MPKHHSSHPVYDNGGINPQIHARLEEAAKAIRKKLLTAKHAAIEIGGWLLVVKELLPHGHFGRWIAANCDFTEHTAQNFMNAAALANKYKEELARLPQTGLFLLAAPTLDEEIRQRLIKAVEDGTVRSVTDIRHRIREEKREAAALASNSEKASDADSGSALVIELASILLGALAQSDLDRVLSIVSSAEASFDQLARALRSNLPSDQCEPMPRDVGVS